MASAADVFVYQCLPEERHQETLQALQLVLQLAEQGSASAGSGDVPNGKDSADLPPSVLTPRASPHEHPTVPDIPTAVKTDERCSRCNQLLIRGDGEVPPNTKVYRCCVTECDFVECEECRSHAAVGLGAVVKAKALVKWLRPLLADAVALTAEVKGAQVLATLRHTSRSSASPPNPSAPKPATSKGLSPTSSRFSVAAAAAKRSITSRPTAKAKAMAAKKSAVKATTLTTNRMSKRKNQVDAQTADSKGEKRPRLGSSASFAKTMSEMADKVSSLNGFGLDMSACDAAFQAEVRRSSEEYERAQGQRRVPPPPSAADSDAARAAVERRMLKAIQQGLACDTLFCPRTFATASALDTHRSQHAHEKLQLDLANADPHKLLGLFPGCSSALVHAKYKLLCRRWHPDRNNKATEDTTPQFQALQIAKNKLLAS